MDDRVQSYAGIPSGINMLVGIWLFISAFVFAHSNAITWNMVIFGVALFILGAIRMGMESSWPGWVSLLVGIWLFLVPFIYGASQTFTYWNLIVSAIIVVIMALWSLGTGERAVLPRQR
jgi:hypothetical protein